MLPSPLAWERKDEGGIIGTLTFVLARRRLCRNVILRRKPKDLVFVTCWKARFFADVRLCENTVHGSTKLTTNGSEIGN
jgi:hypothetical protein